MASTINPLSLSRTQEGACGVCTRPESWPGWKSGLGPAVGDAPETGKDRGVRAVACRRF